MVWMWLIGALGMCTKFFTCTLAVKYRYTDPEGNVHGGPMYYIEQGLGTAWKPLAVAFAVFVMAASFGGGNMFQSNQAAVALDYYFDIPKWISGLVLAVLVGMVIIGGIRRIGTVAAKIVPFMCVIYILGALVVILMHFRELPGLFALIFRDAFTGHAVAGGALGVVIQEGVRRAVFSNEAGMGSAAIAHAAVKTDQPIREGLVAMLGPMIDTLIVCTMTALVITIAGAYADSSLLEQARANSDMKGVIVTAMAFDRNLPGFGRYIVTAAVVLFAFSTMISWSYYGEQGCYYLFGRRAVMPFRVVFVVALFLGSIWKLGPILNLSDILFALMVVPTLISTVALSGRVMKDARAYFGDPANLKPRR